MTEVVVMRVFDEITVDIMTKACGVDYAEAEKDIEWHEVDGVRIPFANLDLSLKPRSFYRVSDLEDREVLQRIKAQRGG